MWSRPSAVPLMLGVGLVFGFTVGTFAHSVEVPAGTAVAPGFAVVELFTSEGCSSCPPADTTLATLGEKAGPRVFPLAFHVDYWDDLGWPDPFASHLATERQRAYAAHWGSGRIYTPQMVVNGRTQFVGSDDDRARIAVAAAMATPGTVGLKLEGDARRGHVRWQIEGAPTGMALSLALVEDGLVVAVLRGENGGQTLRHEHVVRAFRSVPAQPSGEVDLPVPKGARAEKLSIVAYVQDPASMAVLAAERL